MDPGLIASPLAPFERKDFAMNKDRIAGSAKQAAGTIKQGVGHAVGDAKLETERSRLPPASCRTPRAV